MNKVTLNPDIPFEAVLIKMVETHRAKAKDYTDGDSLQNFIDEAYQTGLTPGDCLEVMISVKQGRLRVLLPKRFGDDKPANEPIEDTILDRAVYSVLALEAYQAGLYDAFPSLERP